MALTELNCYLEGIQPKFTIFRWDLAGGVFLDFIEVESEVRELLEKRMDVAYRMERLRPKVRFQHFNF